MNDTYWLTIAVIIATALGPVLAVYASDIRAEHRRVRERKENVFFSLVSTRGARMQPEHVAALNRIELVFSQSSHPNVVDAWGLYLKHLGNEQGQSQNKEVFERWAETGNDLFQNMCQAIADDLKIPFSKSSFKYNAYYPIGYAFAESQQNELRTLLIELLNNDRSIKMDALVTQAQTDPAMQNIVKRFLGGEVPIPVKIEKEHTDQGIE